MKEEQVRVLVLTRYFEPAYRGGGPIQTLGALVRDSPPWARVDVLSSNADLGDDSPLVETPDQWVLRGNSRVWYTSHGWLALLLAFRGASSHPRPAIIYLNSLFDLKYSILPQVLHRLGWSSDSKVLLAPRGELNAGALAIKPKKKVLFLRLFKILRLQRSVLWHASTHREASDIRKVFGGIVNIVTRENETSLPHFAYRRHSRSDGPCRVIFAGRAVPKKGLLILLRALREVTTPMELEIIGAFEDVGYETECLSAIASLPTNVRAQVSGPVPRELLLRRLREADAMVLPTLGENFGHIVAESLSQGCPVICSANTPWTTRIEMGGGLVIDPNSPANWATELQKYSSLRPEHWSERSARAAETFEAWMAEGKGEHVFQLAKDRLAMQKCPETTRCQE